MMLEEEHKEDWMEVDNEEDLYVYEDNNRFFVLVDSFVATISTYATLEEFEEDEFSGSRLGCPTIYRERVPVALIFSRLGERLMKRCYRMSEDLFWKLHSLLKPYLNVKKKRLRGATINGDIPSEARLSMAIRWFAGGDPADIFQVHGGHYVEVYKSVWLVVDAINQCPELQIRFPTSHEKQREIAKGFQRKSTIGISICVGCIDGMLVWTHKPNRKSTVETGVGPFKFFCGRKKKYGLAFQAICDHHRRFLDITCTDPGSISDYLMFTTSDIHRKLETEGFLAKGLALFGDSAYVNTPFMATPYKGVQSGAKDAYNYYHSSLRINIECAFGMLVHRWGVLRKAIPMNITTKKTAQAVRALCILHNFCVDNSEAVALSSTADDDFSAFVEGGFTHDVTDIPFSQYSPRQLRDSGHHRDDVSRTQLREFERRNDLPREKLLAHVRSLGINGRPLPRGSTSTNHWN